MKVKDKRVGDMPRNFVFRLRTGEYEVEICGTREEVLKTIEDLPGLAANLHKAFEGLKPKTVATLTVKAAAEASKEEALMQKYPKIQRTDKCDEAILRILETDWGKWRPRTVEELKEALKANGLSYPGSSVARVLMGLVKKGLVRHWKTDAGYVYILAEKEALT
jgi:predicted transcriptional regulator